VFEGRNEIDSNSFCQGYEGNLVEESVSHYLWDVAVAYGPTPVGEPRKTVSPVSNPATRWKWEITFETFATGEDVFFGWPSENVRTGQVTTSTAYVNFQGIPEADPPGTNTRIPIVDRAGLPFDRYRREVINRPLLIARGYMQDLREFYRQCANAVRTANKGEFFDQNPGWSKFSGGRVLGGSYKDGPSSSSSRSIYYHVQFEFECWGRIEKSSSNPAQAEKLPPPSAQDYQDVGYAAWDGPASGGSKLNYIAAPATNQTGEQIGETPIPVPVPINKDGTLTQVTPSTFSPGPIARTRWWTLRPQDYTEQFGDSDNFMPTTWSEISQGFANAP
jgi:hypothetical protein